MTVDVIVEIPKGSRNKYDLEEKKTGIDGWRDRETAEAAVEASRHRHGTSGFRGMST